MGVYSSVLSIAQKANKYTENNIAPLMLVIGIVTAVIGIIGLINSIKASKNNKAERRSRFGIIGSTVGLACAFIVFVVSISSLAVSAKKTTATAKTNITQIESQEKTEYKAENDIEKNNNEKNKGEIKHIEAEGCDCMDGMVEVDMIWADSTDNSVTIRITNNGDKDINTFGFPTVVIDGQSQDLNVWDNMDNGKVTIAAKSYCDITYYVDSAFFEKGGRFRGELFVMNPRVNDRTYDIQVTVS